MATPEPTKYRAFLSYSHRDTAAAKAVHNRIEAFRVDRDLVGRKTPMGPIPRQLRPIFRDRHDFEAGETLAAQTAAAIEGSAALILLASPAAAASRFVDQEVRLFLSRHPGRPLIPLILDGEPGDPERECFPPALREASDVLAADLREIGDGRELALAKVVARLIGLPPDEVFRRAERERRRRARWRNAILGILALLAVAATASALYAWQQLKTNEAFLDATLKRATDIVDAAVRQAEKYNVPRHATIDLLTRAEGLFDDMARFGQPTPELRYRKAWMLIQFARNYEILGDTAKQAARALDARQLLVELSAERLNNTEYLGALAAAQIEVGDVLVAQGNLPEALSSLRDALAIRERLAESDPLNTAWQRDLSVSHNRIGDVLVGQGHLAEALGSFRDGFAIAERLAKSDLGNARWQHDLSVSLDKIGEVQVAQGNRPDALASFRDSFALRDRLAKSEPSNAVWHRELAVSYNKIGEVLTAQGDLPEALASFRIGLAINGRLAKSDLANAG